MNEEELLFPMPYRLTVNDAVASRGTFVEVRAEVARLVSGWLADDPEGMAADAQTVNLAFTNGAVQQEVDQRGIWFALIGVHSDHQTMRVKVTREG
jgi:hypothetical protein